MADGAVIDAASGTISLSAVGDITLGHLFTTNAGPVSAFISTTQGGIINGGNSAGQNLDAPHAELEAGFGIGSTTALSTGISTLAASNLYAGNIHILNDVGGLLVIGTVGSTVGIQNSGGGFVTIVNNGPIIVSDAVLNGGGGDLTLISTPGAGNDLTINARIWDLGGNGNVILAAGQNLVLNDTGFSPDIETHGTATIPGTGQVLGEAQNVVIFGSNFSIQTDLGWQAETGIVTTLSPSLINVASPQVTVAGLAVVTGSFGDTGAQDYRVTVDWRDGTIENFFFTHPGSFEFTHHYSGNPNPNDPGSPIPIHVTVSNDPNISLVGLKQALIVQTFDESGRIPGEVDVRAQSNGFKGSNIALLAIENAVISGLTANFQFVSDLQFTGVPATTYQTLASVPGLGLGIIYIDSNINIVSLHNVAPSTSTSLLPSSPPPEPQASVNDTVTYASDSTNVEERQVIIEALDADGNPMLDSDGNPIRVNVSDKVLDNLSELFQNFPDGRYKISVIEPGEPRPRLLLDINLRGGKPADDTEDGDKPPTEDDSAAEGGSQASLGTSAVETDQTADEQHQLPTDPLAVVTDVERNGSAQAAVVRDDQPMFRASNREHHGDGESFVAPASRAQRAIYEAALSLGALATCAGGRNWEERVDEALAESGSGALSKAARLARKLRRQADESQRPGGGRAR
jgi:hypothetical protein